MGIVNSTSLIKTHQTTSFIKRQLNLIINMVNKACDGDWEYSTPKAPVPVKLTVKKMVGTDWIVACMVPKGNMMSCMLKEGEDGSLTQVKFNITKKQSPVEIIEVECELAEFFDGGITDMVREGERLRVMAGGKEMVFQLDDLTNQDPTKQTSKQTTKPQTTNYRR